MGILTKDEAQALLKKILSYSKADECEINLSGTNTGNVRYARNAVSTSGSISQTNIVVSSAFGKKLGARAESTARLGAAPQLTQRRKFPRTVRNRRES